MDQSKPIITSTAHILPFERLSWQHFERLCLWLVEREGYERVRHLGLGGKEQGRDVVAYKPTSQGEELWYFQCKQYRSIGAATLKKEVDKYLGLAKDDPELWPAGVVFVVSCAVPASVEKLVAAHCNEHDLAYEFWAQTELDMRVKRHPEIIAEFFHADRLSSTLREGPATGTGQIRPLLEPRIPRHFKNREEELNTLVHLVQEQASCGLFGMGGTGKTILAAYVAREVRTSSGIQVIWLTCTEVTSIDEFLETLAQSLGHSLRTIPDANQQSAYLRAISEGKGLLVVFDDVNQDLIMSKLLDSIGSGNAVLVTGRNQGLRSVSRFGLEVILLESLPPEDATELLIELSGISKAAMTELDSWRALAQEIGNLPLALEVVASDLRLRSKRDPAAYVQGSVSTGKWLRDDEIEGRLFSALQESMEQLPFDYQRAFACLGVFSGTGFDATAVKTVCNFDSDETTEDFLVALRERMLIRDGPQDVLGLHPLVREFAREQLGKLDIKTQEQDSPVGRYIAFYLGQLQRHGGYEWNIREYPHLIPHEIEIVNAIDTAYKLWTNQEFAEREVYGQIVIDMTWLVSWYLLWRGYWDLRIQMCRRITDELERSRLLRDRSDRCSNVAGNLYIDRGWIHLRREEYDKVRHCIERAEPLMGRTDRQFAVELKAQLALRTGGAQEAFELFSRLRVWTSVDTRQWFVYSYRLSDALVALGENEKAIELLRLSLEHIPDAELWRNEIVSDVHACIAYRLAKLLREVDPPASRKLLVDSQRLFRDAGIVDKTRVAAQIELAEILRDSGAGSQSEELLHEALRQARTIGERVLAQRIEDMLQSISYE